MTDWIEGLERLKALREQGHLSEAEYDAAKARLIPQQPSTQPAHAAVLQQPIAAAKPVAARDHEAEARTGWSIVKQLGIGVAMVVSGGFTLLFATGQLPSASAGSSSAAGGAVPASMADLCIGVGAGDRIVRPYDVSLEQLTGFLQSDQVKALAASGVTEALSWSDAGDGLYTLTFTTNDKLAETQTTTKWSFRRIDGKGELKHCGPDTLRFEREVVNGSDTGEQGVKGFVTAAAMASGFKSAGSEVTAVDPAPNASASVEGLVADAAAAAPAPAAPPQPAAIRMAGIWVPEGSYCASGEAMNLRADGSYSEDTSTGKWRQLGTTVTLEGEEPISGEIVRGTDRQVRIVWTGGRAIEYRRCPADGSEPWFS